MSKGLENNLGIVTNSAITREQYYAQHEQTPTLEVVQGAIGEVALASSPVELDESWRAKAACKDLPTDLFYSFSEEEIEAAKSVCQQCPVQESCLEYSFMSPKGQFGVWGGTSEIERAKMCRARKQAQQRALLDH